MRGAANAPGRPERQPGLPELAELPFGAVMTALVALTLAGAVLALTCGSFPVSAQDALAAVWAHLAGEAPADRTIASIVVNVRLPRIILAIAAGAGLAAAGLTTTGYAEGESLKVRNGKLYLGVACRDRSSSNRRANILV